MHNYISIGKIVASYGLKGEAILQHSLQNIAPFYSLKFVFIEKKKDIFLPYFIETVNQGKNNELIIKFEGVETPEQAKLLAQKMVWLKEEDFQAFRDPTDPLSLLGFQVVHQNAVLGEILEVIQQPNQILGRIEIEGKEVYIPIHEQTLLQINALQKKLYVKLPDGLLDIYLK